MRQTVFKSPEQALELRSLFFEGSNEDQCRALELCRAYETRHHLPVSVHLTALLIAALHADVPQNDVYAIRLGYSAALIRMVNEVLDSAQTGKVAAPLHGLAKMLDLPNTFVEARHAATHENIPSIYVLRELCTRALAWLYEKFWALQSAPKRKQRDSENTKQTFSAWRRSRRSHVNAPLNHEEIELVSSLKDQYFADPNAFMKVLFERNILVPSDRMKDQSSEMLVSSSKSIKLWAPALVAMGDSFLQKLCLKLLGELDEVEWDITSAISERNQLLVCWLEYLIEHLETASPSVLAKLGSRPRPWNAKGLGAYYRRFEDPKIREMAEKMVRFTGTEVDLSDSVGSTGKWEVVKRWTPRPIGI